MHETTVISGDLCCTIVVGGGRRGKVADRAGHNFRCPLISPLSVDPLINRPALIFHFENVNLMEERLFLSLFKASVLKIQFYKIL
jgi:hypothetical protein